MISTIYPKAYNVYSRLDPLGFYTCVDVINDRLVFLRNGGMGKNIYDEKVKNHRYAILPQCSFSMILTFVR